MKAERLFRALGLADPALVEEALETRKKIIPWRRWAVLAACLTLVCAAGLGVRSGWFNMSGGGMSGSSSGADTGPSADPGESGEGGSGIEDGTVFMSYAGPVFPLTVLEDVSGLTVLEDVSGLTAEREITWDFAPGTYPDGSPRQWGAEVTDAYVLTNPGDEDVTATALYPFAGDFNDLSKLLPAVTVDGEAAETALYAGAYSGGFQSTFGAEVPDTMNLDTLDSWTEYKTLLEDGSYLAQALEEYPALDMPVTVYEFSDFEAPHEQYHAATQAVSFRVDESATRVFTYGFNGMGWDGDLRQYSYFVPDGVRNEPDLKLLVVLGEDIGAYTLQGYQDGGCDAGEEIQGVSCSVTRRITSFHGVLDRLCQYYQERYLQSRAIDLGDAFDVISLAMYQGAVAELLTQYGLLSDAPMDRYVDGRLDDILSETLSQDRVLYLAFPVTVPAGGSVQVDCAMWKAPSFDYACSGSDQVGLQGYDLVTRLGSGLTFTAQRAALVNAEQVELAGQNFGFDLENGVSAVELDLEQEHYYMEFRIDET